MTFEVRLIRPISSSWNRSRWHPTLRVIVERSMDPSWLSNAYLVADKAGGSGFFVDSGAPLAPLIEAAERLDVQVTHLLTTHGHSDHIANHGEIERRFGATVLADQAEAVGGTRDHFDDVRRSVMDVLMGLPHEMRVYPGHTDETTIGREWEENPFVRVWRGVDPEGKERCHVSGEEATLVVWSPDYDGGGKAWVRFRDGRDAIVGGSRVERR